MLAQQAKMRLSIEEHTDNVNAARLGATGFGPTKPVAPNTDEAGRQKNRRVELVKL